MKQKIRNFGKERPWFTSNAELEMVIRGELTFIYNDREYLRLDELEINSLERSKKVGYTKQVGTEWNKSTWAYFHWCQTNDRPFVLIKQKNEFATIFWDTITVKEINAQEFDDIENIPTDEVEKIAAQVFSILNSAVSQNTSVFHEIKTFLQDKTFYQALEKETTKESFVQSRVGQEQFRAALIKYWQGCSVTGCNQIELLKASHIKPWRYASNQERLNMFNGLLLLPSLDTCFDLGLISFDDEGKILISSELRKSTVLQLGISENMKLTKVEKSHQEFLRYHRENVFRVK